MSVEAMAIVLHHSRARGTAKVVLLGIANHDGDGGAWPSVATLAKYGNVSERNVQKALTDLQRLGEVRIEYRAGGTPKMRPQDRPNLYTLLVRCPHDCDRTTKHRTSQPEVSNSTPPEVTESTPPEVSHSTPKPSYEPPSEPPPVCSDVAADAPTPKPWRDQDLDLFKDLLGATHVRRGDNVWPVETLYKQLVKTKRMEWPGRYLQALDAAEYSQFDSIDQYLEINYGLETTVSAS